MLDQATAEVDQTLTELARSFDLLVAVSPNNLAAAKAAFVDDGQAPRFDYGPAPVDLDQTRAAAAQVDTSRCGHPAAERLLEARRVELLQQIDLVSKRDTPAFLGVSRSLYGDPTDGLVRDATAILARTPASSSSEKMDARDFGRRVEAELALLGNKTEDFRSGVEFRDDVAAVMVSHGRVMIPETSRIRRDRVEALVQHEVGTHVVTHHNGRRQTLGLLEAGTAGYEETQEGLAVLMEYLAGGLTDSRMRTLAGRVVGVDAYSSGDDFVAVTDRLRALGFGVKGAFSITARIARSGGFTKDVIYLRGLQRILDHLSTSPDLDELFAGKVSLESLDEIRALAADGHVAEPALLPPLLDHPDVRERLERCVAADSVLDLIASDQETPS